MSKQLYEVKSVEMKVSMGKEDEQKYKIIVQLRNGGEYTLKFHKYEDANIFLDRVLADHFNTDNCNH